MYEASPSRTARSFDSFHELGGKLGVQKLLDLFNLEFSLRVRSNLDDQSRFVDKRYANRRVRVIGGLEGYQARKWDFERGHDGHEQTPSQAPRS